MLFHKRLTQNTLCTPHSCENNATSSDTKVRFAFYCLKCAAVLVHELLFLSMIKRSSTQLCNEFYFYKVAISQFFYTPTVPVCDSYLTWSVIWMHPGIVLLMLKIGVATLENSHCLLTTEGRLISAWEASHEWQKSAYQSTENINFEPLHLHLSVCLMYLI